MNAIEALDRSIRLTRDLVTDSVSSETIVQALQSFRVRCYADARNLSTYAGQTALLTFVNLVARMGIQIDLAIPSTALIGEQHPVTGTNLLEGLLNLGQDLIPNSSVTSGKHAHCDAAVVFGNSPLANRQPSPLCWRLLGCEWAGEIGQLHTSGPDWEFEWPVGAMISATLAATEVYKAAIRRLPVKDEIQLRLLEPAKHARITFSGETSWKPSNLNLGAIDIVSAGAITQGFLYALFRLPNLSASLRIFESECLDLSNLNRYMLMRRSHIGWSKLGLIRSVLPTSITVASVPERLEPGNIGKQLPLASSVIVGVDHIASRWLAQQYTHGRIAIGATSHFFSQTSSHRGEQACGGCLHPRNADDDGTPIPTISFVSFWAGLALASRLVHETLGQVSGQGQQDLEMSCLRLDQPNGFLYRPVAPRFDCPVRCAASRIYSSRN